MRPVAQAVVTLPVQYRMATDIMALPNALIYGGALRCGTDAVARTRLEVPGHMTTLPPWVQQVGGPPRPVQPTWKRRCSELAPAVDAWSTYNSNASSLWSVLA